MLRFLLFLIRQHFPAVVEERADNDEDDDDDDDDNNKRKPVIEKPKALVPVGNQLARTPQQHLRVVLSKDYYTTVEAILPSLPPKSD